MRRHTDSSLSVGVVGCGFISHAYLRTCASLPGIAVVACADLDPERALSVATSHNIQRACTVEEVLADNAIDCVLNLTPPQAHAALTLQALRTGKHVYSEKPLAIDRAGGRAILETAVSHGLYVGCAPDTFLGNAGRAARRLLADGVIGRPVAVSATFMSGGNESWHPDPAFFYRPGGGPLFDMGPYYLTMLVTLLGPIRRVSGIAHTTFAERTITSSPCAGEILRVEVPTHYTALLEFESGPVGSLVATWDVALQTLPHIEISGTAGTIQLPNPGYYVKPALVRAADDRAWTEVFPDDPLTEEQRGIGLSDMADACREGGAPPASGDLAYHILDVMCSIAESAQRGGAVEIDSRVSLTAAR